MNKVDKLWNELEQGENGELYKRAREMSEAEQKRIKEERRMAYITNTKCERVSNTEKWVSRSEDPKHKGIKGIGDTPEEAKEDLIAEIEYKENHPDKL